MKNQILHDIAIIEMINRENNVSDKDFYMVVGICAAIQTIILITINLI
jgi:hypothetical protein